jgi:MFS family permease
MPTLGVWERQRCHSGTGSVPAVRPISALVDLVCPPRLGDGFRRLLASSWTTNLADGLAVAAGPLLVASQTGDPLLVALAGVLQRLPWLIFGLHAGVLADRLDRRRIMMSANLIRAVIVALLAGSIMTGSVNVAVVLVAMFLLGTSETLVDITAGTLLPMVVERADLGLANSRLQVGLITLDRLAGPPIGAFLFAAGMASPFIAQAVLLGLGGVLIARIRLAPVETPADRGSVSGEIREGARWLWNHPPLRALTLTILAFNVTFGSTLGILVLYADQRLGLDAVGFGLLTTVGAAGGILGSIAYHRLERRFGMANLMRVGLVIETLTHLILGITTMAGLAMAVFFVFGVHEAVWGTTVNTVRHRAVPTRFQGRVNSVYMLALMGGLVVGGVLGGSIARIWGITAPFWFAFAGSVVILALIWRRLDDIVGDDDAPPTD